jgi:hypothetical protein
MAGLNEKILFAGHQDAGSRLALSFTRRTLSVTSVLHFGNPTLLLG